MLALPFAGEGAESVWTRNICGVRGKQLLAERSRIKFPPHLLPLDRERVVGLAPAKSRNRFQELELTRWDAVRPDQRRWGLLWDRSRSWPCFAFDDGFSVGEEYL